MYENKKMIVTNRSASTVVYSIPSRNTRRVLEPGASITVSYEELEALNFERGGTALMANYLLIKDADAPAVKSEKFEPEYYYTEADVKKILGHEGSLDELLDMLDFAPDGVLDLIKKVAVEMPLNDVEKREAIKNKTSFDVNAAIENAKSDKPVEAVNEAPKRRTSAKATETTKRRTKKTTK